MVEVSGHRAVARCDQLGAVSDSPDYLFRPYLGPAHLSALKEIEAWMTEAGMTVRLDPAGTLIGRYEATAPGAAALLIASHIDSVRDAGRYDGPLGVMLGIECVDALHAQGRRLPFAVEVAAFGDEEGSRFPASMLASRAVAGLIDAAALEVADSDGITLEAALAQAGLNKSSFLSARRDPSELIGYLETHIEQGPVLEAEGLALGVVTGIAAQKRFEVVIEGVAGHAGTNAMALRKDALAAAAEAILAIERIARGGPGDLVATVGRISASPGAPNVVPGVARFSIDVRAGTEAVRDAAADAILQALEEIAGRRGVTLIPTLVHDLAASPCDAAMIGRLQDAVAAIGQPVRPIVSGAGHDAMALAKITPAVMLFLRCAGGISHNPLESVDAGDADLALRAMRAFIDKLEETQNAA